MTTQTGGEVIPSDKPRYLALAVPEPTGVVNLVTNAPENAGEVVGALIDHPAVRRINFTGSTGVGRIIAVRAAQNLKPCLLELGGKAPLLVLADADLDEAVRAAAFGALMNAGQICMSTERIFVVEAVADAFVALFRAKVATMPAAVVVDRKTVDHVTALVDAAVAAGASLVAGGPADGVVMPPHVVAVELTSFRNAMYHAMMGENVDGRKAADWGFVNEAVPAGRLRARVTEVAQVLLKKNPVALKASKDAVRRVGAMTYDEAEDYLIRAQEAANSYDNEGRKDGIKQFLDDKSYKPWLGAYDTTKQTGSEP